MGFNTDLEQSTSVLAIDYQKGSGARQALGSGPDDVGGLAPIVSRSHVEPHDSSGLLQPWL